MESFNGPCQHQSVPVEVDERLTPDSLNFPPCDQCDGLMGTKQPHEDCVPEGAKHRVEQHKVIKSLYHQESRGGCHLAAQSCFKPPGDVNPNHMWNPQPEDFRVPGARGQMSHNELALMMQHGGRGIVGPSFWSRAPSIDNASLERPLPLMSNEQHTHYFPSRYPATPVYGNHPMPQGYMKQCACCPPANTPHPIPGHHEQRPKQNQRVTPPSHKQNLKDAPGVSYGSLPQRLPPSRDVVYEVSVARSLPADPGAVQGEVQRTISLPEECRNIFITYSKDSAKDLRPFVNFLVNHHFNPSIDIFNDPLRSMAITKWMDRFLNDKSVLIIVVISPGYLEDVEGDEDEEHSLHTKYIHNQIQNEFIQQGCLNYRLVPVLFPNATKKHVPSWLRSTRIYRWPQDIEDLLLRLFREERYIIPQQSADLTITVRPL